MAELWEKIRKTIKEGIATATEKTEELTKLGKAKIDILTVKHQISKQFTELGGIVYEASKENKEGEVLALPKTKAVVASLKKLEKELTAKEKLYEDIKKKEKTSGNKKK